MPDIYCLLNIRNFLFLYSVVNIPYILLHSDIFVLTFIHEHCIVCFLNTHALKLVKFDSNKGENNYDFKKNPESVPIIFSSKALLQNCISEVNPFLRYTAHSCIYNGTLCFDPVCETKIACTSAEYQIAFGASISL